MSAVRDVEPAGSTVYASHVGHGLDRGPGETFVGLFSYGSMSGYAGLITASLGCSEMLLLWKLQAFGMGIPTTPQRHQA
jgi:hypothetical protein